MRYSRKNIGIRLVLPFIIALFCVNFSNAQSRVDEQVRFGFYNLQNLFDTINDPGVDDAEFLDTKRYDYTAKIDELTRVILLLRSEVLGVCEVENYGVLDDLAKNIKSKGGKEYEIVHYDSRDNRGIDVALLVDHSKFKIKSSELIDTRFTTRGFLRAELKHHSTNNKVVVYVAHLPSKRGGAEAAKRRDQASLVLDSLALSEPSCKVVVCGDFNDAPKEGKILYNLAYKPNQKGIGSYAYYDVWTMIDQFIITPELRRYVIGGQKVLMDKSLITTNGRYKGYPTRNHPSDHLPIYIDIEMWGDPLKK